MLPLGLAGVAACTPALPQQGPSPEFVALQSELESCRSGYAGLVEGQAALRGEVAAMGSALESVRGSLSEALLCQTAEPAPAAAVAAEIMEPANATSAVVDPRVADKLIVGRRERIWIEELQLALPARIDTGTETSSIDARDITEFERDGKSWVRFEVPGPEGGELIVLERSKVRDARVLQSNTEEPERRPVIRLGIRLGDVRQLAEFTLSDRGHLDFPLLIGRNVLRDVMLVDVSGTFLVPSPESAEQ